MAEPSEVVIALAGTFAAFKNYKRHYEHDHPDSLVVPYPSSGYHASAVHLLVPSVCSLPRWFQDLQICLTHVWPDRKPLLVNWE